MVTLTARAPASSPITTITGLVPARPMAKSITDASVASFELAVIPVLRCRVLIPTAGDPRGDPRPPGSG
jgi:hypothetical protein